MRWPPDISLDFIDPVSRFFTKRASAKVVDIVPRLATRYARLVKNLETVPQREVVRARTQIKKLVGGEIKLVPAASGDHLEAEFSGDFRGSELSRRRQTSVGSGGRI